ARRRLQPLPPGDEEVLVLEGGEVDRRRAQVAVLARVVAPLRPAGRRPHHRPRVRAPRPRRPRGRAPSPGGVGPARAQPTAVALAVVRPQRYRPDHTDADVVQIPAGQAVVRVAPEMETQPEAGNRIAGFERDPPALPTQVETAARPPVHRLPGLATV